MSIRIHLGDDLTQSEAQPYAANHVQKMEHRRILGILVAATAAYAIFWSYVSIAKLLSLNAYVFDLGINAERGWAVLHAQMGISGYLHTLINSAIVFPLSPLTGSGNYFAMLTFQAVAVALVAPALYRISVLKGLSQRTSLLNSLVSLLYFPTYGIFWFDFHYQVFFLPLFVIGYMFYLEERYLPALFFLLLSGMVRFPYSVFPAAFAFIEIAYMIKRDGAHVGRQKLTFLLAILVIMVAWTLLGYLTMGLLQPIAQNVGSVYAVNNQGIAPRVFAVILFLAPLLFLPLISPKWVVLAFPAFYLMLSSNNAGYTYHLIMQGQYVAGIVPFMLLGFIDATVLIRKKLLKRKRSHKRTVFKGGSRAVTMLASVVLASVVLFNFVFAPFGPLNSTSSDNFNFSSSTSYSIAQYNELNRMVSLIPGSDPYVAYQNNLPQVLPRQLPYGSIILMGGYLGGLSSFSTQDALNNTWPVSNGGEIGYVPLDYAIADADNPNFYHGPLSTYSLISTMYSSGSYGILSEGHGLILLKRNYTGAIEKYVPDDRNFSPELFINESGPSPADGPITKVNDTSDNFMFYGPGTYLYPGSYKVTFMLRASNISAANNIWLQVTANSGNTFLGFEHINGSWFHQTGVWQEFNLTVNVNTIYGKVEFRGFGIEWSGSLSFDGVRLSQQAAYHDYGS